MSEFHLQCAVADYLEGRVRGTRINSPFPQLRAWTFVANEGRSAADGAKFKRMGVRRGVSDCLFWWEPHGHGCIELKMPNGVQSGYQKDFQSKVVDCGFPYAVCRSVAEVRDTLIAWGLECTGKNVIEPNHTTKEELYKAQFNFYKP